MDRINRIAVDTTHAITDLCVLATEFPTDKSAFHVQPGHTPHRHPYTAVYDMLFATRRYDPLVFGELGVLDNMSMHVWRGYFPNATLYGFDAFPDKIEAARQAALPRTHYALADVGNRRSLFDAFNDTGRAFDVLIDDSTHLFDHQILFIGVALEFVRPGGMVIVEDVFRGWDETRYCAALQPVYPYFSSGTFIETNHAQAYSAGNVEPYYNNDKLLVLVRNETPVARAHPTAAQNRQRLDATLARPEFKARERRVTG